MFKDTIQTMMNAEFDSSMGYEKSDNKIEKTNYRNGSTKKKQKVNLASLTLRRQETGMVNSILKLFLKIKEMFQVLKIK